MNVYIAPGLANWKQHNALRDILAWHGIGITYDWTKLAPACNEQKVAAEGRPKPPSPQWVAMNEMNGVRRADMVIVLLPGGRGTHTELGAALALGKRVHIFAPPDKAALLATGDEACVFYHHILCRHHVTASMEGLARAILSDLGLDYGDREYTKG